MGTAKSRVRRRTSTIINHLQGKKLEFLIEISNDSDYEERKRSIDWMINNLGYEKCHSIANYRILHKTKGEFYVYLEAGHTRKMIFSSSNSHVDAIIGKVIDRKNYLMVLDSIVQFFDVKLDE